jgi:hypothetical protein
MCGTRLVGVRRPKLFVAQCVLLVLGWLACLVGWLLIFPTAETVIGSGPVIFGLGVAIIIVGAVLRHVLSILIGAGHCAVCLLFVVLVNIFDWSPSQAHVPFLILGIIYVVALVPVHIWAWHMRPRYRSPWECQVCGYTLYGLHDPRCPECGTAFDPGRLAGLPPPEGMMALPE